MKRALYFVIALSFSLTALVGCSSEVTFSTDPVSEESSADASEEVKESDEILEEIIEDIEDPLKDNESVVYYGDLDRDNNDTKRLLKSIIDNEGVDPLNIGAVFCSDFDLNGSNEAFIFVYLLGDTQDDETGWFLEGDYYFANEDGTEKLPDSQTGMWSDMGRIADMGARKYFIISEQYGTGANSIEFSIYDGKLMMDDMSYMGYLYTDDDDYLKIVSSVYDNTYDKENKMFLGHTWKDYYCYYDKENDCLTEYGGSEIEVSKLNETCNYDITGELSELEAYLLSAYYRPNGIININYFIDGDYDMEFRNASYDMNNLRFLAGWGLGETDFAKSDQGGIFYPECTYGNSFYDELEIPETKEVELFVYSPSNSVKLENGNYIVFGNINEEGEIAYSNRAFVIDGNTAFEYEEGDDIDILYCGIEKDMSPLSWFDKIANADEDMQLCGISITGVYGLTVTGSHVDKIHGLYWWD